MQIVFVPAFDYGTGPRTPAGGDTRKADDAVAAYRLATGIEPNATACREEWHEATAQLLAAIRSGIQTYATTPDGNRMAFAYNTGRHVPDPTAPTILLGRLDDGRLRADDLRRHRAGDVYGLNVVWPVAAATGPRRAHHRNPAFAAGAGRATAVGTAGEAVTTNEEKGSLIWAVREVRRRANGPLLIGRLDGTRRSPRVPVVVAGDSREEIVAALIQGLGCHLANAEGMTPYLVQAKVGMTHEYRFVALDGEIVAGAGAIDRLCPADNQGTRFDPATERTRGDGTTQAAQAEIARMATFARGVARGLLEHEPAMVAAVLDTAIGDDGAPLLVDVGATCNARHHAMDFDRVLRAVTSWLRHEQNEKPR